MYLGGLIGTKYCPSPRMKSSFQHFVSGLLIASVAIELLPNIIHQSKWTVALGFVVGTIVMLLIRQFAHRLEKIDSEEKTLPLGLLFAIGVDIFIDGLLIGVSFLAGAKGALLVAIALGFDVGFLGLTCLITLKDKGISPKRARIISSFLPLLVVLGAAIGTTFLAFLPKEILIETLAFGVAALLYLAVEELLIEAHKIEENSFVTSMFFLGFLLIFLI